MAVNWKVLWKKEDGPKTFKRFPDDLKTAIIFAKSLKRQGLKPNVVSSNKAWPPTKEQELKRRPGDMWCPYCIKWRHFKLFAVKKSGYTSEAFMRCPVCTISTNDHWVKRYNGMIEHLTESELIRKLTRLESS